MFLAIFGALFIGASGRDLLEPKFQVLTPHELMVQVPHYDDTELVTFRIGVRRRGREVEDLELGENDIDNNRIFIYDQRLNLRLGDTLNYLAAFRDEKGYRAQTGVYVFDGVYYKKSGRRQRLRRGILSTTDKIEIDDDAEEFNPTESRFGGRRHHHHHGGRGGGQWPGLGGPGGPGGPQGFNPFGPPRGPNFGQNFPNRPPSFGPPPNFGGGGCNDHRHDMCHGRDTERWQSTSPSTTLEVDVEYHCKICNSNKPGDVQQTTSRSTTEEVSPDIDIRFSD